MTSSVVTPEVIISGGMSGNPAGSGKLTSLQVTYQNLLSGAADIVSGGGTKTLNLTSGAITTAAPFMAGLAETSTEVAINFTVLQDIARFCNANNIKIRVDANLTSSPTWSSGAGKGHNELVDQWAQTAAAAGLPIAGVEDVQEVSTVCTADTYQNYASIEVNAVRTLIADYASSTYRLTSTNLAVGDMEGGDPAAALTWWKVYDTVAAAAGIPTFSYATADTGWFGPWIGSLSQPSWQSYLEGMSAAAALENMSLNVVVQGALTETSGDQFVRQSEQNAANLAMLQAKGAVHVSSIMLQSWGVLPVGVAMITSPTSSSNEAAEIQATYPLYTAGLITAQGTANVTTPGQIILNTGTAYSITSLSVQSDAADVAAGGRLAVVIIDQTGTLAATQHGAGTVSRPANNILVLDGNAVDLAAELKSITLVEGSAGPDTIDIQTYSIQGRVSDSQIDVLAAAPGQSVALISATSDRQGWLASSAILNSGTVVTDASILTSETLYWSTTGVLAGTITGTTMPGRSAFTNIVAVHEPLAQYGVKNASATELGTAAGAVADIYDPKIDYGAFPANGYANNPGINNVGLAPLPGWISGAFDAAAELTPLVVQSTVKTFDPGSGTLQSTVAYLASDQITVVDNTGNHVDTFASAFNNGGTQVTEFNTGSNAAWKAGWGNQFSAATLTYTGADQLVELFLQGNSSNPWFTIDDVFDPNSGKLWEEFQSTMPPPKGEGTVNYATTTNPYQPGYATGPLYVTQFNTGDNPNWDYLDWGSSISTDTEVWTDYFIMANFAGFAENFPMQYAGALNAYPYQFVNGSTLDVLNLPGSIAVNLNTLGTVTIASQTMMSSLAGLNAIDAAGATGIVTITGRAMGGSWLAGGDNLSTITGFGHDTIIAGAGTTNINTGAGSTTIQVASANSAVTVTGNNNAVSAVKGSMIAVSGNNNTIVGAGLKINIAKSSSLTLSGDDNITNLATGGTITVAKGIGETINGSNATIVANSNAGIAVVGTNNTVSLIGPGIILVASGHNSLYVNDIAIDVAGTLDALEGLRAKGDLKGITLTDSGTPTLTLTAAQLASDVGALGLISGGFSINSPAMTAVVAAKVAALSHVSKILITDTAGNVTAALDALQALVTAGKLKGITLTDSGTPTLTLTAAQLASDVGALGLISGGFSINSPAMTAVVAAKVAALSHVSKILITDTAGNVTAALDALQALVTAGKLKGITLTDSGTPTLTLTAAQLASDVGALGLISGGFSINSPAMTAVVAAKVAALSHVSKILITDTAGNVTAALDALQALVTAGKLKGITLTDSGTPTLTLTAAQLASDVGALGLISGGFSINSPAMTAVVAAKVAALSHVSKILITDTAGNVTAALDALQALVTAGKLKGITLTDSGTPTLTLTAAQLASDVGALGLISGGFSINSPAMTAVVAAKVAALSHVSKILITDTAGNVTAALDALQALVTAGKLKGITLTDSGTPTLTLTAAQLASDVGALGLISGGFSINSPAMTAVVAAKVAALSHVSKILITDTAGNVTAALDALQALVTAGKLKGITLTDSGTPTLTLTAAQLASDVGALGLISGGFSINSPAMTAVVAAKVAALSHVSKILITDTAGNVTAALDALQALVTAGKLKGITLTDSGTPTLTLTAAQLASDVGALGLISGGFSINSPAMTAAVAAKVAALSHVSKILITDTAGNVTAALDALQALVTAGKLKGITLTDSGTPTLTLTAAQLASDVGAVAYIMTPHKVTTGSTAAGTIKPAVTPALVNKIAVSVPGNPEILAVSGKLSALAPLTTNRTTTIASGSSVTADIKIPAFTNGADHPTVASTSIPAPAVIPTSSVANSQHIFITADNLNISPNSTSAFIHTGSSNGINTTSQLGSTIVSGNPIAANISKIASISLNEFKLGAINDHAASLTSVGNSVDHINGTNIVGLGMATDLAGSQYTHILLAENSAGWVGTPAGELSSTQPEVDVESRAQDESLNDPGRFPVESPTSAALNVQHKEDLPDALLNVSQNNYQRDRADDFSRLQKHLLGNPDSLDDQEILEMVLHIALNGHDVRPVARALLAKHQTFGGTIASPSHELLATPGLGKKGMTVLKLIQAAAVNVLRKEITKVPILSCWDQLIDYLSVKLKHERVENFRILFLDSRGAVIADEIQGHGTIDFVAVFPREIVRRCLELHANALILVHNHPSGDPAPSQADIQITCDVERAAAIMGITLHDHVIVGRYGCRSFRQEKLF